MTVKWNGDEVMAKVRAGAMRGVIRGTERVHDLATRKIMDPPKTGKKYSGLPNRSSAPGESPATQSGRLQQSGRTQYDVGALSGTAGWSAAHALPLEVGTEDMAPRPYARPALAESVEGIRTDVADEIAKALG
jgi:hypothetical protein